MVRKKFISELISKYFSKCPLCGNPPSFKVSGIFTKSIQCKTCSGKWKCESKYRDDIEPWLKYVEPSTNEEYNWLLEISRPFWFWATLDEVKEIDWEKTSKNLPKQVKDSLILEHDEKLLARWFGTDFWGSGVLVLTDQRLIWLRREDGSYYLTYALPLEHIAQIVQSVFDKDPGKAEKIEILDVYGVGYGMTLERMLRYPAAKPVIEKAIKQRKRKIIEERKKEKLHVLLDFSFIRNYLEKGGIILQTYKCPECGAHIKLPEHGTTIVCKYCGAVIKAEDIFKKIKDFLT